MSDFDDSTSRPPDREETISAVNLTYNAVLDNLISAGVHLSDIGALIDLLDDGDLVSLPFLLSRQLEVIRLATQWVMYTKKGLRAMGGDDATN